MARGAFNPLPAASEWFRHEWPNGRVVYTVVPFAAAGTVVALRLQVDDLGSLQAGSFFLAGLLLNMLFRVFDWSRDAARSLQEDEVQARLLDPYERGRYERRMHAVERTYRSVVWATLVALLLAVVTVVGNTASADAQQERDLVAATAVIAFVGGHLLTVLVAVVNRVFSVTRGDIADDKERIKAQP
ncbi:hypothetical protein BH23ACT8_BH23ACT8_03180 [soil metagenome]